MNAPVTRVLSAPGEGFVANGVEFTVEGKKHTALTKEGGEVIVSAGSVYLAWSLDVSDAEHEAARSSRHRSLSYPALATPAS